MTVPGLTSPAPAPSVPLVIRRTDLLAQGISDNRIRRARSRGLLISVAPGAYLRVDETRGMDAAAWHRAAVGAVVPLLAGHPVVSHASAAVMHGLLIDCDAAMPVHVSRSGSAKSRRGPRVQVHRASVRPGEVVKVDGIAVTSVARTILDCACVLAFEQAVALAQAALRGGWVSAADLAAALVEHSRTPGVRQAVAALESVLAGLPTGARLPNAQTRSSGVELPPGFAGATRSP